MMGVVPAGGDGRSANAKEASWKGAEAAIGTATEAGAGIGAERRDEDRRREAAPG